MTTDCGKYTGQGSLPPPPPLLRGCLVNLTLFPGPIAMFVWQNNGVSMLAELVAVAATEVRSAAMGALMMITTVDAGEAVLCS